ncbi:TetR family transcriptional regulator C-terminal domain-containing protein [Alteromonas sp. CYL-A6]|uniref:TetR family transcriptional regulator C-terminal domain-containing protein n=1 Tax=Alteromonas nitratireducens TaxID=3390813 RepID=UPI0034B4AE22
MSSKSDNDARIGARNRRKILEAAEQAFARFGFKGASVQQIADMAGIPKTNLLYYFKSKQALYSAVFDNILNLWTSQFEQATPQDDPADVLSRYIAEKMTLSRTQPTASRLFAMEILSGAPNLSRYFNDEHVAWMKGRTSLIQSWIDAGKMTPVNPEFLLYQIWASTEHYANFAAQISLLHGGKMRKADYDEATYQLIQSILAGCGLSVPDSVKATYCAIQS